MLLLKSFYPKYIKPVADMCSGHFCEKFFWQKDKTLSQLIYFLKHKNGTKGSLPCTGHLCEELPGRKTQLIGLPTFQNKGRKIELSKDI